MYICTIRPQTSRRTYYNIFVHGITNVKMLSVLALLKTGSCSIVKHLNESLFPKYKDKLDFSYSKMKD